MAEVIFNNLTNSGSEFASQYDRQVKSALDQAESLNMFEYDYIN